MESKIINGDCLKVLKTLKDNSIDAIVTDPPYGISFMGKKWDYDVPKVKVWKEVLRVLKPGGYALVACGTRTQHRMAVNLEDAGFEIRDIIAWIYGSGFPKGLNIGKEIDKIQGNKRKIILTGKSGSSSRAYQSEKQTTAGKYNIDKGNSKYEGWGTALKPAMELWTLCRKPLEESTVAENVLKYGTGGINIDECRIGTEEISVHNAPKGTFAGGEQDRGSDTESYRNHKGRFPANVITDGSDEVLELFPETKKSTGGRIGNKGSNLNMMGNNFMAGDPGYGDSGSAARFFYCAKASKSERNKGCENFKDSAITEKKGNGLGRVCNICGAKQLDGCDCKNNEWILPINMKNNHPTVKPISLMRYLCRLITPKEGTVLDPFAGSGSTGIAAELENFNFIGIEISEEYCKIAEARIKYWKDKK